MPLEHLADYTARLTEVFEKHGTRGTWYAHASVGCLHVRPVLNLRLEKDVKAMRAIAEEAFAMVREYKGSHSGEHGDGIVRSEFHELMFGTRLVRAFEEVKDRFDPDGPVQSRQDRARAEIRRPQQFPLRARTIARAGDESRGSTGRPIPARAAVSRARSRCATTTAPAASSAGGVMCPSYRVTRDERDVTRGRANSLRLAITGQLGPDALTSDEMAETMKLCVSCKGCRRECPTGVDMARMKIEVLAARAAKHGLSLHDRLVGYLPRYAPYAAKMPWLLNLRDALPGAAKLSEAFAGFSARRSCRTGAAMCSIPNRLRTKRTLPGASGKADGARESCCSPTPSTAISSARTSMLRSTVLSAGGYRVHVARPADGSARPLCCGRTFLCHRQGRRGAARGRAHARRARAVRGARRAGDRAGAELHPRLPRRGAGDDQDRQRRAACRRTRCMFEEFLAREAKAGRLNLPLDADRQARAGARPLPPEVVRRHGRGRSASAGSSRISTVETDRVELLRHGRRFGYGADTIDVSLAMGELSLLPAVRKADAGHADRRRRHLVPPPDPRRRRPRGAACRARAGDESANRSPHARRMTSRRRGRTPDAIAAAAHLAGRLLRPAGMADRPQEARRPLPAARARQGAVARAAGDLAQAQDDATLLAIHDQERAGLDIITDGEMRRESYSNRFATALEGVDIDNPGTALDRSGHPNPVPRVAGKIRRKHPVEVDDVKFLRANTDRTDQDHGAGPVHHVAAGAERFLQGRGGDGAGLRRRRQRRDQGPVRGRRRHRADRRALHAGAAGEGAASTA